MNKFPEFSQHLRATKLAPKINSFKWSPGDCVNCSLHDFFSLVLHVGSLRDNSFSHNAGNNLSS